MEVYRGFSCWQEALNVLTTRRAGGTTRIINLSTEKLVKECIIQKGTGGEGFPEMHWDERPKERNVIEYSRDLRTAKSFGLICVIGIAFDDSSDSYKQDYVLTELDPKDSEQGVFFRVNAPIDITYFELSDKVLKSESNLRKIKLDLKKSPDANIPPFVRDYINALKIKTFNPFLSSLK